MKKELYDVNDFLDYVDYYYEKSSEKIMGKYVNGVYVEPVIKIAKPNEYLKYYYPNREFVDVNTIMYYYEKILHYAHNHELFTNDVYEKLNNELHSYFANVISNIVYLSQKEKENFIGNLR